MLSHSNNPSKEQSSDPEHKPEITGRRPSTRTRSLSVLSHQETFKHFSNDGSALIVERLHVWREFIKGLILFFAEIAKSEKSTADSYKKCAEMNIMMGTSLSDLAHVQAEFLEKIAESFQAVPHRLALEHDSIARCMDNETIMSLRKLKYELKRKQKLIADGIEVRTKAMTKSKEELDKHYIVLRNAIHGFKGINVKSKDRIIDPWVAMIAYRNMLKTHAKESRAREEQRSKDFEEYLVYESFIFVTLKNSISNFTSINDVADNRSASWLAYQNIIDGIQAPEESNAFVTKLRDYISEPKAEMIMDELDIDDACRIIKEGVLHRPKRITGWKDHYFVLTRAGYLHEFEQRKDWDNVQTNQLNILNTINLADSVLGAHSLKDDAPQEFEIVERRHSGLFSKSKRVYRIRGLDLPDTRVWWDAIAPYAKTALTSAYIPSPHEDVEYVVVDDRAETLVDEIEPSNVPISNYNGIDVDAESTQPEGSKHAVPILIKTTDEPARDASLSM